ncbi:MAG: hypothetical protein EBR42_08325 [Betaproteobacteria bacterium]|jgi:hypothetical protein|nr:hypothetical protein [Betaproteobacteria bacterium]
MRGFAQRLAWLCASLLGIAFSSGAQDTPGRSVVTVCAEAANSYALQTEVYSDAIKLLMYESRNNPAEQTERLDKLKPRHEAFKQTALAQEQTRRQNQTWGAADVQHDTQIKTWVTDNLLAFATEKYGQDALFFKFYIVNRCKKQFAP